MKQYIRQYGVKYANEANVAIKYTMKIMLKTITFFLISNCITIDVINVNKGYPIKNTPIKLTSMPLLFFSIIKPVRKMTNKPNMTLKTEFLLFNTLTSSIC